MKPRISHSIFNGESLIRIIQKHYGFSSVYCEFFMFAYGDIYQVSTPRSHYIFRIYHHISQTKDNILSEIELLDYLHQHNLSVAHPQRTLSGDWLLELKAPEGIRYAALFTFAEGEPISEKTELFSIQQYGELLGQIHQVADSISLSLDRKPITFKSLVDNGIERLKQFRPHQKDAIVFLEETADFIRPKFLVLSTSKPHYGMCHGDASPTNVHISLKGHPTLFDFDLAGASWRIYDVGSFISAVSNKRLPSEFSTAFLDGYERIRKLDQSERDAIPMIKILRKYLTISLFTKTIEPFGGSYLSDAFITQTVKQIKEIMSENFPY